MEAGDGSQKRGRQPSGAPSSSLSETGPPPSKKGKQRAAPSPDASQGPKLSITMTLLFNRSTLGKRSCRIMIVDPTDPPDATPSPTDLELPNDDSLVKYVAEHNLTNVKFVEACFELHEDLQAAIQVLVPMLENHEINLRIKWPGRRKPTRDRSTNAERQCRGDFIQDLQAVIEAFRAAAGRKFSRPLVGRQFGEADDPDDRLLGDNFAWTMPPAQDVDTGGVVVACCMLQVDERGKA
ncbi:hypothetical protein LTR09_003959 [Extremus antarcticus]|uniref:Uncharacterized protein n=1 Tax=Extremus antarcticus TaxID=702011 RepID=A0AAJ0DQ89_9PEZI|nr:hypothetical protein LTR09_003959 [Extremus antarcticus]